MILPRTGRDVSFYLAFFLLVLPLCSVIPFSWFFVVYSLSTGSIWSFGWKSRTLFGFAVAEALFSIYYYNLTRSISGQISDRNDQRDVIELQSAFLRVLQAGLANVPEEDFYEESSDVNIPRSPDHTTLIERLDFDDPRAVDFRNHFTTWFRKVPWSHIRKEEVSRWLYWSIFDSVMPTADAMPQSHRNLIEEALKNIEKRAGCTIPDGSNPSVTPALLTLDPVNVSLRPLIWYAGVSVAHFIARIYLRHRFEIRFGVYQGFEYFVRVPDSWSPESHKPQPIVFVHGLGLGLPHYAPFLTRLMKALPDHPILVPIQAHISQDIFHPRFVSPMDRRETIECLAGLLRTLGWVNEGSENAITKDRAGVTMLSHSNGSYIHAWFMKGHPEMLSRSCFIDPVTFCAWEGDVCYNFLYKPCRTGFDLLMYYFVCSDPGVANYLQRRFVWSSNVLWYEDIPNARDPLKSMFVLGGRDAIVKSERVVRYLRSHGIRKGLLFTPNHRHGQALLASTEVYGQIMDWLRS